MPVAVGRDDIPASIGRYEIRRELGRGTMGVVYEAWDPALGRTIALKMVGAFSLSRTEREAYERRFQTEARAAAGLSHPGIVVVHDVGRDAASGLLFMALEYLDGETLADRLASGRRFEWREALRITARVAEALHHAHGLGVVHRDVKPANVMILRSGEPKILDFGIARVDAGHLTTPGELFGTPLYMSPEQALGQPVDARSDLFSLGTIAYALLTGQCPFAGPSVPAIMARVAHRGAPPPSELVPGLPRDVDDVLARAMAKSRDDRYSSGRMMAEDIDDVLGGRPPRHRAAWTPTPSGDRTIASSGPALDGTAALDLVEDTRAVSPPRGRWRSRLERLALVAVAAVGAVHFSLHPEDGAFWVGLGREAHRRLSVLTAPAPGRIEPRPAPATPSPEPVITATPDVTALPSPEAAADTHAEGSLEVSAPPVEATPVETLPTPAAPPAPASTDRALDETPPTTSPVPAAGEAPPPSATPSPSPSPPRPRPKPPRSKPASPPARKPAPSAWLSIGFEHHLASGTLEVWVDGKSMAKEALDSRVTRKLLMLELRSGSVQQTLTLTPGRHEVRVRLRSGDDTRTARASRTFKAGATRRLEVNVARLGGGLSLEWK
jgi:serine/threonine-protein kinase